MVARVATTIAMAAVLTAAPVEAEPYRLRGDVFVHGEPSAGLLMMRASDDGTRSWVEAEAVVWGETTDGEHADALVIAVRLRDPEQRGDLRLGRFLVTAGAVRPVHIDGAAAMVRAPWGMRVETFAGMPVVPGFGERDFDWLTGGRVSRQHRRWGTVGVSYLHRRDAGRLADEEIGLDAATAPRPWLDVAARGAFDLVYPGISDANLSVAARRKQWRLELYGARRSPSRLLPATSLFAALGDVPSSELGSAVRWYAAPRLDLLATAAARAVDGSVGEDLSLRATLRLDDRGRGALGLEGRRQRLSDSGWTGVRATARVPIAAALTASTELELAAPDEARGRGAVWPWALVALSWRRDGWDAAAAVEASASPEYSRQVTGLVRLARLWGQP